MPPSGYPYQPYGYPPAAAPAGYPPPQQLPPPPTAQQAPPSPHQQPARVAIEGLTVTGCAGPVFGTDVYAGASNISAAAVHHGIVSIGETKSVQVVRLGPQEALFGTHRNGVLSNGIDKCDTSFAFINGFEKTVVIVKSEAEAVTVTGTNSGAVWGSGIYTADSNMNAAALHAGVVAVGETKVVHIARLPGQSAYHGSAHNGVTSLDYGQYAASFKFLDSPVIVHAPAVASQGEAVTVTGADNGSVWGSGIYTADSDMNAAALHAGVVAVGETKVVHIARLPGQSSYHGSAHNSVSSQDYGQYSASFKFLDSPVVVHAPAVASQGEAVTVTGANNGSVWGSGIYTADSDMNAAALHAGVVAVGETKVVHIARLPGQSSYHGSAHNGVSSQDYGEYGASFKFV